MSKTTRHIPVWIFALLVLAVAGIALTLHGWEHIKTLQQGIVSEFEKPLDYKVRQAQEDIAKLDAAVKAFRETWGCYPPSRLRLRRDLGAYSGNDPLDSASVSVLTRPRTVDLELQHDWSGGLQPLWREAVLEGDQCLVFFLGGIPGWDRREKLPLSLGFHDGLCLTWSGNPRIGPFFSFDPHRLADVHGNGFWSYLDPWGTPYAYFCVTESYLNGGSKYGGSDCARLGLWPYAEPLNAHDRKNPWLNIPSGFRYINEQGWQIISAGPDKTFGPGTVSPVGRTWTPATADQIDPEGRDDLANFSARPLGVRPAP